jgi:hypothetical protein
MAAAVALQATLDPTTEPCEAAGQVTLSGTIANPGSVTAGDTIAALFENCDDNLGFVIDGQLELTVTELQGDILTDVFLLSLDMELVALTLTEQTESFSADGDFSLTLDSLSFPVTSANVTGSELTLASRGESWTLSQFNHSLEVDATLQPDRKTARASGDLESPALGGRVQYRTILAVSAAGDEDPESGEIRVTGAEDSSVTIVIVDSAQVRLDIDENGDGIIDTSLDTTWAALNGQTSSINSSTARLVAGEAYRALTGFAAVSAWGSQFTPDGALTALAITGVAGTFGPVTIPCLSSGDVEASGFVASAGTYSAGDTVITTFNRCARTGDALTGELDVTVASFDGAPGGAYRFAGDGVETELQVTANDGRVVTGNGTLSTSFDFLFTTPNAIQVSSTSNAISLRQDGETRALEAVTADAEISLASAPPVVTASASGRLTSPLLTGPYDYQTVVPLMTVQDQDPDTGFGSGELLVTAADGSSVKIVALNELQVRLDIDLDGDQVIDEEIFTTWAAL